MATLINSRSAPPLSWRKIQSASCRCMSGNCPSGLPTGDWCIAWCCSQSPGPTCTARFLSRTARAPG